LNTASSGTGAREGAMRNNSGSGAVALIIIFILISLVYLGDPEKVIAGRDEDSAEYHNIQLSVSPIQSTTAPIGWKMALISYNKEKFVVYYEKDAKINLGWGTGSPDKARANYNITDESNPPGPNGWKPFGQFILKIGYSNSKKFSISGLEQLNEKNYLKESGLQSIILNNDEEEGKEIFEKVYKKLEKIDTPRQSLSDE
jgi:hypothetical protein